MKDILEKLIEYSKSQVIPMHMPGGKRNIEILDMPNPFSIDITEIHNFDNLHNPNGILKESMDRISKIYGAYESLYLVNGSTAGILSAISGVAKKGAKILVARNCHVSVYNAIEINELKPVYIISENNSNTGIYEGVKIEKIRRLINENKDACAMIITSPTYEGKVSEVREIVEYLHKYGIPLIVDAAHGAHFIFSQDFPEDAIAAGADIVINSTHKTLPALTQTGLLHFNNVSNIKNDDIEKNTPCYNINRVKKYWNIYQTTSPSYVLMASIDRCLNFMVSDKGKEITDKYIKVLKEQRLRLKNLKNMYLEEVDDISKFVIVCENGNTLAQLLRDKYNIEIEMASFKYIIAMTSVMDSESSIEHFVDAILDIDRQCIQKNENLFNSESANISEKQFDDVVFKHEDFCPEVVLSPYEAVKKGEELGINMVELESAVDKIAAQAVLIYPPGIPIINTGEKVTKKKISIIENALVKGLEVIGLKEGKVQCLR